MFWWITVVKMMDYGTVVISKNGSNYLISEQLNQVNGIPDVRLQRSLSWWSNISLASAEIQSLDLHPVPHL